MKYTIKRLYSIKSEKFEIIGDSKKVYSVKAVRSKEYKDRFK